MLRTATGLLETPQFTVALTLALEYAEAIAPSWSGRFQAARCLSTQTMLELARSDAPTGK